MENDCITALKIHADSNRDCSQCPYVTDVNCFNNAIMETIKYVEKLEGDVLSLQGTIRKLTKAIYEN